MTAKLFSRMGHSDILNDYFKNASLAMLQNKSASPVRHGSQNKNPPQGRVFVLGS